MKIRENLICRFEDGVIFDTEKGVLYEMNDSANEIVRMIYEGKKVEEILDVLDVIYDKSNKEEIAGFVEQTILDLREKGILDE